MRSLFQMIGLIQKRAIMVAAPIVVLLSLWCLTFGESLQNGFARPAEYGARHLLGRDPKIDPRVQVYALDDATVNYLGDDDLSLKEWARLFASFEKYKPRAIFVDRIFGNPHGLTDAEQFVAETSALSFPIITGGFVVPTEIPHRPLLSIRPSHFDLCSLVAGGTRNAEVETIESLDWLPYTNGFAYGPNARVADAFKVGHLNFGEENFFTAFMRLTPRKAFTAAPLLTAKTAHFDRGQLFLDGHRVPLDRNARVLANYAHPSVYLQSIHNLENVLKRLKENKAPAEIPADSVVLVLPGYHSGATDLLRTPFGMQPAGFLSIAAVNSVLTGDWVSAPRAGWLLVPFAGFAAMVMALWLEGLIVWTGIVAGTTFIVVTGIGSFCWLSVELPWLFGSLTFFCAGLAVYAEKARAAHAQRRQLRTALEGSLPPAVVTELMQKPATISFAPTGRVVTIMFIDIVGFSVAAERQTPQQAFMHLKETLNALSDIVYRFGGVVDKTLGDGMLCYFGYHFDGSASSQDHADQALRCALELQRTNLKRCLSGGDAPVYPLRIGVNTAAVYMGDLGNANKIDLTLIGHGVNLAKRLESACDMFDILLGATTKDMLLSLETTGISLEKRFIQIKHHDELIEAYEADAFETASEDRSRAVAAYRAFARVERRETRWTLPSDVTLKVAGSTGVGHLTNFSENGLGICHSTYLGRGVTFNLSLDSVPGGLQERLAAKGLTPIACEVRWGRPAEDGFYQLGLTIKNFTAEQRKLLLAELRAAIIAPISKAA